MLVAVPASRLRAASGTDLVWVRPSRFTRDVELRSGDEVLATLRYPRMFGTPTTGESEGERLALTWQGILRPVVRVRASDSSAEVATVRLPWLGWRGRPWLVRLADGRTLRWAPVGLTDRGYTLAGPDGAVVLRLQKPWWESQHHGGATAEMRLEIAPIARTMPELPLLVLLGRYLMR